MRSLHARMIHILVGRKNWLLKNQIFISYRRCDGKTVAKFLYDYLTHMNYLVFRDEESAHNGRFDEAIYNAIDECKDFILIVSPKVAEFDNSI